jgi:hypothetical protein
MQFFLSLLKNIFSSERGKEFLRNLHLIKIEFMSSMFNGNGKFYKSLQKIELKDCKFYFKGKIYLV